MASTQTGEASSTAGQCQRCNENAAAQNLRTEAVCNTCYTAYVAQKAIKRLETLQKATRGRIGAPQTTAPQKYLLGLSFGSSSSALLHVLSENIRYQRVRRGGKPKFEVLAVHIDTDLERGGPSTTDSTSSHAEQVLRRYEERYDTVSFRNIPLAAVLGLRSIDWSALPQLDDTLTPSEQLVSLFRRLPSTTSRADILRLLVRHLLIATAGAEESEVLLLGHSTTALAELTLSETAKGRGFSLPWQVNDGVWPTPSSFPAQRSEGITGGNVDESETQEGAHVHAGNGENYRTNTTTNSESTSDSIPIYHPLREVFRRELHIYNSVVAPPLTDLIQDSPSSSSSQPQTNGKRGAVVSHKDLSIEEVMMRYFEEVELNYPSVVANVVKTTGKLSRPGEGGENGWCGVCGMALDELGDERWRGELGEGGSEEHGESGRIRKGLCYGCERSIHG